MKYFIDQEFIEGFHKPFLGKRRHFVDLISIGIVAEDGRSYYAISEDFREKDCSDWVKKNVLPGLHTPFNAGRDTDGTMVRDIGAIFNATKSNKEIATDIISFVHRPILKKWDDGMSQMDKVIECAYKNGESNHEFYGYYSDYDWVLFCSLFGTMMELPIGFPMYCKDLKQSLDEAAENLAMVKGIKFEDALKQLKSCDSYPKNTNEHSAIADANFNKDLYKFLKTSVLTIT